MDADAIVVGGGALGSAACRAAARSGLDVRGPKAAELAAGRA